MHPQDALASLHIGVVHYHPPVKAARPQQRRVENIGTVGRRDQDDAFIGIEAVHFDQQLIQRLLALVMASAQTRAAVAADRVDFIHEDDAGSVFLSLLEEVADPARADADKHLHEVGS